MPIRAAPYAHQREAYEFCYRLFTEENAPGAALLMEMGTGKTLTTIAIAGALWLSGRIKRVLIVAPLSIVGVWREAFAKFAIFRYNLAVLSGSGAKKAEILRGMVDATLQIAVVNYESAWRLEDEIKAWRPDLVVCDEGHKIKTHSTNASKAMHRLGGLARYKMLLTGTPVTNKALDIFSQYKFLNDQIFGKSFYSFRNRYFDMVGYGQVRPDRALCEVN
jgi:SNF2 family DNA or RNA helicase